MQQIGKTPKTTPVLSAYYIHEGLAGDRPGIDTALIPNLLAVYEGDLLPKDSRRRP
jgi:hypothetical protein